MGLRRPLFALDHAPRFESFLCPLYTGKVHLSGDPYRGLIRTKDLFEHGSDAALQIGLDALLHLELLAAGLAEPVLGRPYN